ncbi:MAG: GntR family transcriptional regulator [Porticoccaceae bacterium]
MRIEALGNGEAPIQVKGLYVLWTGDGMRGVKSAERVAWHIESALESANVGANQRLGSEQELIAALNMGVGAVREALEILDLRGICTIQPGPGGGIFSARPDTAMTAQILVHYLLRSGVTGHHLCQAQDFLDSIICKTDLRLNPAISLFAECVAQLIQCLPGESLNILSRHRSLLTKPLADIAAFNWKNHSGTRITLAKKIGWDISRRIVNGCYTDQRIGSEEVLCSEYGVSRASMRKAIRLMESMGIIECRPGRGQGLFVSPPNPVPVVRAMNSYLLGVRMSEAQLRAAIQVFGGASLMLLFGDSNADRNLFLKASMRNLAQAPAGARLPAWRAPLKSAVQLSGNGILTLFWLGLAGYTFRTARAENIMSEAVYDTLPRSVLDMLEGILSGSEERAIASYQYVFTSGGRYPVAL